MARPSLLHRFRRSDRGALLVEFAIILPLLILIFGVIIEGGRMMWSYQTAAAGVRDAARYAGRVLPSDLCTYVAVNGSVTSYDSEIVGTLRGIVQNKLGTTTSVLPAQVTLAADGGATNGLVATVESCTPDVLRVPEAAVVLVAATVEIDLPFRSLLEIMGGDFPDTITTTIVDRTRVFGS